MTIRKIAVIGAGIIGTTCAVKLIENLNNRYEITIISEDFTPNTTGDISAGLWSPYLLLDNAPEKILQWSKVTHDVLQKFWQNGKAAETGICLIPMIRLVTQNGELTDYWKNTVFGYNELSDELLEILSEEHKCNYTKGVQFVSFTCEPTYMLPYLYKIFMNRGGHIRRTKIESFEELSDYDLIINCTGLGARLLANDSKVVPIRGQVIRVNASHLFHVFLDDSEDGNYIIPNTKSVVLGQTHQINDYNTTVDSADRKFIFNGCAQRIPCLQKCEILKESVGLRPGRSSVCLEQEQIKTKSGKTLQVIHNYGHGGSGVTLSWGCAEEVSFRVRKIIEKDALVSKL